MSEAETASAVARAADVALLAVYGGVSAFFCYRFARHRRLASLGVACLPLGWFVVALWGLHIVEPHPLAALRWLGVVLGLLLLAAVIYAEARD